MAELVREPHSSRRSARPVDRQGTPATTAEGHLLDMDSSERPTYGEREGSAYNGHFGCTKMSRVSRMGLMRRGTMQRHDQQNIICWLGASDCLEKPTQLARSVALPDTRKVDLD
jgi:hypothetical protein